MNRGLLYAIGAYGFWGLIPVFWKLLDGVPAIEILGHRMVWSLLFVGMLLAFRQQWQWLRPALTDLPTLLTTLVGALLIAFNWYLYIWAVNAGYIIETSLGYFINPLVSVVLGVVVFRERLRLGQWLAVGLALLGVVYLTITYGSLPWIALSLAVSFATYGVIKKTMRLGALEGLSLETALLFLPALAFLIYRDASGVGTFGRGDLSLTLLLTLTGLITAGPLLLFAAAARRIPFSSLGILQYIAPTCQFLLGVFVYAEPFSSGRLVGFSLIWLALLIYSIEGFVERRRPPLRPILGPVEL